MMRLLLILTMALGLCGCRGVFQKGSSSDGDRRDPLYGRYIPKTDLPLPGRDSTGRGRDPLLSSPTSGSKKAGEPFRNSAATTIAGLAGTAREETGMSLGDRRTVSEPTGRGVPLKPRDTVSVDGWDDEAKELRKLRARYDAPRREPNGDYSMTATVPMNAEGALRRYEAVGTSAVDAARSLLQQIRSDR